MEQSNPNTDRNLLPEIETIERGDDIDLEKRKEITRKFYSLSSSITLSTETLLRLMNKTKVIKGTTYNELTEDEEAQFIGEMDKLNLNLGSARSILDSYVVFSRSQPDFDKFFNLFYQVYSFVAKHRNSIFYQVNAKDGHHYYPYVRLESALHKLKFLFSRLCGTLNIAGDFIMDSANLAQNRPQPMSDGPVDPYQRFGGGGGGFYDDWRRPFYDRDVESPRQKKKIRDIGDIDDKI